MRSVWTGAVRKTGSETRVTSLWCRPGRWHKEAMRCPNHMSLLSNEPRKPKGIQRITFRTVSNAGVTGSLSVSIANRFRVSYSGYYLCICFNSIFLVWISTQGSDGLKSEIAFLQKDSLSRADELHLPDATGYEPPVVSLRHSPVSSRTLLAKAV